MDCINLKERFGDRFKVTYEESYYAQYGPNAQIEDPWLMIIPCQNGHIYPHGGETLAASTDRCGSVAKRLAGLDCVTVVQDGSDGTTAAFDVSNLDRIAQIMIPRKGRRRLSPEHRARLLEVGRKHRFPAGSRTPNNALESHPRVVPV